MVGITQRDYLEALSRDLSSDINNINLTTNKSIPITPANTLNKIRREAQVIFDVISYLGTNNGLGHLYSMISDGINASKRILATPDIPENIKIIINRILILLNDGINELNIIINIQAFKTNQILIDSTKTIEDKVEKAKDSLSNIISQTEAKLQAAYDNNKTAEEYLKKTKVMLDKSDKEINKKISEIDTELDEIKSIYKTQITNDFTLYKSDLDNLKDNISSDAINQIQTRLVSIEQDSIKRQTKQYSERLNALKEAQDGALERFNGEVDDQINTISSRIEKEVDVFSSKKVALEKVIGAIGGASMSHEHKSQAGKEFKAFVFFQLTGFVMLLLAVSSTLTIFGSSLGFTVPMLDNFISIVETTPVPKINEASVSPESTQNMVAEPSELVWFLQRISLVLLLTAPGIFLLKEATIHRQKENLYRQRGIQLAAIEPFIDEFPEDEKVAIKKELVKNFFTFHDGKADTKNVPDFVRDMKEAVSIAKSINSPSPRKKSTILGKGSK